MSLAPPGANSSRAAFTLLEMLAVVALILVLSAVAIGAGRRAALAGQTAHSRADLAALAGALESYKRTFGDYPRTEDSARLLQSLLGRYDPAGVPLVSPSLLDLTRFTTVAGTDPAMDPGAELADAWGQAYRYAYKTEVPWGNPGYVLYSIGPDSSDSPALLNGGFPDATSPLNADNLYANRP